MDFDRKKLGDVRNKPEEIIKLIETKDKDFMAYLKTFENKKQIKEVLNRNYDIAIYTVGLSIYPLLFSLKVTNPNEKAIFFYTKKSEMFKEVFEVFKKGFNLNFDIEHEKVLGSTDTAEIYNEIEKVINRYKNKKIAIDITGGKKPTIAAGFFGASLHEEKNNIDILYMDFTEYSDDTPVYGSEFITILLNPNYIFSAIERKILKRLFNSYQYRAARKFSKEIRNRLRFVSKKFPNYKLDKQLQEIEKLYYFSSLYESRNDFNYKECEVNYKYLNTEEIKGLNILKNSQKRVEKIEENLFKLGYRSEKFSIELANDLYKEFKEDKLSVYFALDRYISALRYKDIDYQSYILRLVSALEISGVMYSRGQSTRLEEKIRCVSNENLKRKLHELRIIRNNLNLIHGFKTINAPKEDFEAAVLEYISQAFDMPKDKLIYIIENELKFRTFDEIIL
ncbi:hypothetical protein [Caloranaerobacter sp. DY30410]|uniref:hypothetical protein n=1 Tax=Caloranaerobacter sp. DY30410 TaxID=3238305 RepID=UPI003CFDC1F5